jgi:hypothetical protein
MILDDTQADGTMWEGIPEIWDAYFLSLRDF